MRQVVVFMGAGPNVNESYTPVEQDTNAWLAKHPDAVLLASHTNMVADRTWTEYAITLIVEVPENGQPE